MATQIKNSIIQELGKNAKIIRFRSASTMEYDPLEDLIGIVKMKKQIDVEELLDYRGFENARKHIGF